MTEDDLVLDDCLAKAMIRWLAHKGYMSCEFNDPRLSYVTVQLDADLWPEGQ